MIQNPSGRWYRSVMVDGSRMGVLEWVEVCVWSQSRPSVHPVGEPHSVVSSHHIDGSEWPKYDPKPFWAMV
jgi:hypothetical protein